MHYDINFIPVTNLMHKFIYSYNVTILYLFGAVLCSSSGGQIVCVQLMVSSLSMSGRGGRAVHWLRENSSLNLCTVQHCTHTIWPPEDEHNTA